VIAYARMPAREWDGASYDRISAPQEALGRAVLERMRLRGDETVLDAGCGSGRVTEALLERLPRGRVIAVDASPSMVQQARLRLGDRAEVREQDLLALELPEPIDGILSTATFHWVLDHDALFRRLRAALRPGGQLVAQCGGEGNIDRLRGVANAVLEDEPYVQHFRDWSTPWYYAPPGLTRERLLAAGFSAAKCWLQPAPQYPEQPREFLAQVILGPQVQRLPADLRDPFLDTVLDEVGESALMVDYIRLNIDAVA
jgi:trans-aconitate 2-methyltransferase